MKCTELNQWATDDGRTLLRQENDKTLAVVAYILHTQNDVDELIAALQDARSVTPLEEIP